MTENLGEFIRVLRTAQQMSLRGLATTAGISPSALSKWEANKVQPRIPELDAVLNALRCPVNLRQEAYARINAPRALARIKEEGTQTNNPLEADYSWFPSSGDLLRSMRLRRSLSLEQAATLLGVKSSTICRWERSLSAISADYLDTYCTLLGAEPEERQAMHHLFLKGPVSYDGRLRTLEESEQQLETIKQDAMRGEVPLIELRFLSLEAQLWHQTAQATAAWNLLARSYVWHAQWLLWQERRTEAGRMAERALQLVERETRPQRFWFRAVHIYASYLIKGPQHRELIRGMKPSDASRCIEYLQNWLPYAQWPETEAWMYHNLVTYQLCEGSTTEALATLNKANTAAALSANPQAIRNTSCDSAVALLKMGQCEKALSLLSTKEQPNIYHRVYEAQTWTATLLALGETSAAHKWWTQTRKIVQTYNLPDYYGDADILQRAYPVIIVPLHFEHQSTPDTNVLLLQSSLRE